MTWLTTILDWIAPPGLQGAQSAEELTRRRILAGFLLLGAASSLSSACVFALQGPAIVAASSALAFVLYPASILWLRRGRSHRGPALLFVGYSWLAIAAGGIFAYGGTGLDGHWNLVIPLFATYMLGPRAGVGFGALVILEIIGLRLAIDAGALVPRPMPGPAAWFNSLGTLGALLGLAVLYDAARTRTARELAASLAAQRRLLAAIEAAQDGVVILDGRGLVLYGNAAARAARWSPGDLLGRPLSDLALCGGPSGAGLRAALSRSEPWKGEMEVEGAWLEVGASTIADERGEASHVIVSRDISERRRAELQLAQAHRQLVAASRRAGMAEVATDVLHNVGNVLNSVSTSASLIQETARQSRLPGLARGIALLTEHEGDLPSFFREDPRSKSLPEYLRRLSAALEEERSRVEAEGDVLRRNVEHITRIVSRQQAHVKMGGAIERTSLPEAVEDALELADALNEPRVELVRDYADLPAVALDRHRLIEILVNLVKNARDAGRGRARTRIAVTIRAAPGGPEVEVADDGCGIPAEHLGRIFSHGFTTRPDGHGFGLHGSACAAAEAGWRLAARSDGPGRGAAFTLSLQGDAAGRIREDEPQLLRA